MTKQEGLGLNLRRLLINFDNRGEMTDAEHLLSFQETEALIKQLRKELRDKVERL